MKCDHICPPCPSNFIYLSPNPLSYNPLSPISAYTCKGKGTIHWSMGNMSVVTCSEKTCMCWGMSLCEIETRKQLVGVVSLLLLPGSQE